MQSTEYKTVTVAADGPSTEDYPGLEAALNLHGAKGWRLVQTLEPALGYGERRRLVLVLERGVPRAGEGTVPAK
jgi:hypothetical protein